MDGVSQSLSQDLSQGLSQIPERMFISDAELAVVVRGLRVVLTHSAELLRDTVTMK